MAWVDERAPPLIRPLLAVTKRELVGFLNDRGLEWREDESNQSAKYKRNKVRTFHILAVCACS